MFRQLLLPGIVPEPDTDERDTWATPWEWYHYITQGWGVIPTVDVCASTLNHKCAVYITEKENALVTDWARFLWENSVSDYLSQYFWMNPPYSQPLMTLFIEQALSMLRHPTSATVFLLPDWTDREWYHTYIKPFEHEFTQGRIPFVPPPGIKPSTPKYGNVHGVISNRTRRRTVWPVTNAKVNPLTNTTEKPSNMQTTHVDSALKRL